jgi:hypothetical protein
LRFVDICWRAAKKVSLVVTRLRLPVQIVAAGRFIDDPKKWLDHAKACDIECAVCPTRKNSQCGVRQGAVVGWSFWDFGNWR